MNGVEISINDKEKHIADGIYEFTVDGEKYSGVTSIKTFWEKVFPKQPERANNGAMGDLNNIITTYCVFRFIATYDIMPIDDFRRLMKQFIGKETAGKGGKTEFNVTCYDHIYNKVITKKMYLTTPQMPEYWTETLDDGRVAVLGVKNFTIEFAGTNND